MKNFVFCDYFTVKQPSEEDIVKWEESKKEFSDSASVKKGLMVTLEASHSGLINKNNRFYIPARMDKGISTWTTKRNKSAKILKHHDSSLDPIGIIRGAKYVDTVPADLKKNPDIALLLDKNVKLEDQVDAINNLVKSGILDKKDWRGLGYTEIKAEILDEDAIEKILDKRLDAVSTSFLPTKAICTVCKEDVMKSFFGCGHTPGQWYSPPEDEGEDSKKSDKILCMWIPDKHENRECSFVSFDADPITAVTVEEDGKEISLPDELKTEIVCDNSSQSYEMVFSDSQGVKMVKKNAIVLSEDEKKVFEILKKHRSDIEDKDLQDFAKIIFALSKDGKYPDQEEAELDEETVIVYALEDLETKDQEINADEVYDEMIKDLGDAKLSTTKRKKLAKSVFCSPKDRAFPIPDCAHVTAGLRLLDRYKGPGNKASILACIRRKEKALGCTTKKKDNVLPTCKELKDFEEEALRDFFALVEAEMIERKLKVDTECSDCAKLQEEIEKVEADHKETQTIVDVLRGELRFHQQDFERQVDEYIKLGTELEGLKIKHLATLAVLTGKNKNLDEAIEAIKTSDLEDEWIVLTKEFDLEKARAKLNDGMTREPEGTVEDSTINTDVDNTPQNMSPHAKLVTNKINRFYTEGQKAQALGLFDKMKSLHVFDSEVTFESILVAQTATTN